jgi:hypothetical protein
VDKGVIYFGSMDGNLYALWNSNHASAGSGRARDGLRCMFRRLSPVPRALFLELSGYYLP